MMLLLTFRALNDLGSSYLKDSFFLYIPDHSFRAFEMAFLQMLFYSQVKGVATQGQAFAVVAPRLWSSLLGELRRLFGEETHLFCLVFDY